MRKILTILLIAVSLNAWADKWYIATTGSDSHGKGTSGDPWLTLKHAADTVTGAAFVGDTIMVGAGTFTETTAEITLGVGVSIMGTGATSIINLSYVSPSFSGGYNHAGLLLASATLGTDGSQSISYMKLDGNLTGTNAILVKNRSNVIIHDCTIEDFLWNGITYYNLPTYPAVSAPATYATGNQLYNCTINNCTGKAVTWEGGGDLAVMGQDGILIHDNILRADGRAQGYNGDIMGENWCKNLKYYNNKSYKLDYDGDAWNFHLELFSNSGGGIEIYNNEFHGGDFVIDITGEYGNTKGVNAYTFRIYDNYFTGNPVQTYHGKYCIDIEGDLNEDIYIYNNLFEWIPTPIHTTDNTYGPSQTRRVYIYYNIFNNCGWNNASIYESNIVLYNGNAASVLEDFFFYNNILKSDAVTRTMGFRVTPTGTFTNIMIKNNIILGHTNAAYMVVDNDGTIDYLEVMNNITYDNSNSNDISWVTVGTRTNFVESGNIKSDPLFVSTSDFHLQSTSPAINAGIDVSAITGGKDFHGASLYGAAYDIGAFEYGTGRLMILNDTIVPTINYKIILIDH